MDDTDYKTASASVPWFSLAPDAQGSGQSLTTQRTGLNEQVNGVASDMGTQTSDLVTALQGIVTAISDYEPFLLPFFVPTADPPSIASAFSSAAVQAAIDAAHALGGGTVWCRPGTYTFTAAVKMQPNVTVIGQSDGVIFTQGTAANLTILFDFFTNTANKAQLLNCIVDGNRSNNTNSTNVFLCYVGTANDARIEGCILRNAPGYGVDISTGLRCTVRGNQISNCYVLGVSSIGTPQLASNHFIVDNTFISPLGQHAIAVVNSDYVQVRGNKITGTLVGTVALPLRVSTSGTSVTYVSGTTFTAGNNVVAGLFLVIAGSEYLITSVNSSTSLTINSSAGVQANVAATIGPGDLISLDSSSNFECTDNVISGGCVTGGIVLSNSTGGETAQKLLVSDNIVRDCGQAGIYVQSVANATQVNDIQIVDNLIIDCGLGGTLTGANYGISVLGAQINNVAIDGNVVRDDQGTPTMANWLYAATASGVKLGRNYSYGTTSSGTAGGLNLVSSLDGLAEHTYAPWQSYTPTVIGLAGGTQSYTTIARYAVVNNSLYLSLNITVNSVTSGGGSLVTFTLPLNYNLLTTMTSASVGFLTGREDAVTGKMLIGRIYAGQTTGTILTYDSVATVVAGYNLLLSGSVEIS